MQYPFVLPLSILAIVLYVLVIVLVIRPRREKLRNSLHVFLDLESYGTRSDAAVLAIGAVCVNMLGEELSRFKVLVAPKDALRYGTTDESTRKWWDEQSNDAKRLTFDPSCDEYLPSALIQFNAWYAGLGTISGVWGNGPTSDCSWLRNAYRAVGGLVSAGCPFDYWQERCVRTAREVGLLDGCPDYKYNNVFVGTPHNCVDDAAHQATYTVDFIRNLI